MMEGCPRRRRTLKDYAFLTEELIEDDNERTAYSENGTNTPYPAANRLGSAKPDESFRSPSPRKDSRVSNAGLPDAEHDSEPPYDDSDLETNLDVSEVRIPYDETGQTAYEKACTRFGALPASCFTRSLTSKNSTEIDMKYYGMGPKEAMAISIPMLFNTRVTSLNLQGNDLGVDGLATICKMLGENNYICDLNLANNGLKSFGARHVAQMLQDNATIKALDISGNEFTDADAAILAPVIEEHAQLRSVNLSNNAFGSGSSLAFRRMIGENGVLQEVNLGWNNFLVQDAIELSIAVRENIGLKVLDVSWNGFDDRGSAEMAKALKVNGTLTELTMNNTRVKGEAFIQIIKSLKDNDTLKTLRLGKNPINEEYILAGLELIKKTDDFGLEHLDLSDIICSNKVQSKIDEVKEIHENFTCRYGYTDSYGKRKLKSYTIVEEAMTLLVEYAETNNIKLVDLFAKFDEDGSMSVTYDEFRQGLKDAKIPLTALQVDQLIQALDQDGDGEIDFSEFVLGAEDNARNLHD